MQKFTYFIYLLITMSHDFNLQGYGLIVKSIALKWFPYWEQNSIISGSIVKQHGHSGDLVFAVANWRTGAGA
jgi:hypothetical protein